MSDDKKITVQVFDAKPNKMFPDWLTERTKFLRFSEAVPCALCGKKRKTHWTLACRFRACKVEDQMFVVKMDKRVFQPGNQVCRDHLLEPVFDKPKRKRKKKRKT